MVRSGEKILSNVVFSQIATHQPYGGVVPELASREHLRGIVPVVRRALEQAGRTYENVDAIAHVLMLSNIPAGSKELAPDLPSLAAYVIKRMP